MITVAVRWYLRYGLSYRDVEELLAERGDRSRADYLTQPGLAMMRGMADMRRRGPEPAAGLPRVEHTPGMADELMRELAPLLAEDGIDLSGDDLPDMPTLQAALNRAVERRNLELFSPVGATRQIAVDTLHRVVAAILAGDSATAGRLLQRVQPESADNSVATVSSCIGIALGLLDDTLTADNAPIVALPPGRWNGERAATDILALARKGKAFRSLDKLLMRQGGHQVLNGSVLALAAATAATARESDTPISSTATNLIR